LSRDFLGKDNFGLLKSNKSPRVNGPSLLSVRAKLFWVNQLILNLLNASKFTAGDQKERLEHGRTEQLLLLLIQPLEKQLKILNAQTCRVFDAPVSVSTHLFLIRVTLT